MVRNDDVKQIKYQNFLMITDIRVLMYFGLQPLTFHVALDFNAYLQKKSIMPKI